MFSFSLVIKELKNGMTKPISDEDLINLLIADIVKTLSLESKSGGLLYIDKKTTSEIMNNKSDLPKKIKGSLNENVASTEGLESHLNKKVISLLIPEKIEEVSQALINSIREQENVPEVIMEEISKCEENKKYIRLIAIAIRYSFMIPNKQPGTITNNKRGVCKIVENIKESNYVKTAATPLEIIMEYLRKPSDWERSYSGIMDIRYYKYAPEYTIEHTYESEEHRTGYEYYLFSQSDTSPLWANIRLKYHQTVLYQTQGVFLDGGRYFTACPEWGVVYPLCGKEKAVLYKYLIKGDFNETIHQYYYNGDEAEEQYSHDRFIESIIVFSSREEKIRFDGFANSRWDEYVCRKAEMEIPYIEANTEQMTLHFQDVFRNVRLLQLMYRDFLATGSAI